MASPVTAVMTPIASPVSPPSIIIRIMGKVRTGSNIREGERKPPEVDHRLAARKQPEAVHNPLAVAVAPADPEAVLAAGVAVYSLRPMPLQQLRRLRHLAQIAGNCTDCSSSCTPKHAPYARVRGHIALMLTIHTSAAAQQYRTQ